MTTTRRWVRSAVTVAGAALALGVVTGGSAFADMDLYKSGAVHSWRSGTGVAAVEDTKADGNDAYAKFNRNYPDKTGYEVRVTSGSGTKAYSPSGSRIWDMQACVGIDQWPDDCSDWWTDNHAHG
ncbi:hypothetical protein [Streptomyces sp. HF10]|uniref:hypothetical protein n=1 Tax=Streptomyces sp. HF10 TaxID=2692233 RepID=UPI001319AC1F|nr:hypothetical protein [Streptomyces sp. HF10]QHC31955.1 hypothetical protein GR129_27320 [Streptomyces sp. HF10]